MTQGRSLGAGFEANITAAHVTGIALVEMDFDGGTVYFTDAPHDVTYAGNSYLSLFGVGSVSEITETDTEVKGMQFSISGVSQAAIAMVLTERIQGRPVKFMLATLSGTALSVDLNVWAGILDVMSIQREDGTATINITAEHPLARWDQPNLLRYSHQDQLRLHPGDMFFEFAESMAEVTITWPGKEFFKR